MDSINDIVEYIRNLLNFKPLGYFNKVEFKSFDEVINYLKTLFNFESSNFNILDEINNYLNSLIDFGSIDFKFLNNALNYIKTLFGYEDTKMDKNDVMLDNMYSSAFKATCYTRDNIPKNYLPYGLISDPKKYLEKVSDEIDQIEMSVEIYDDCLKYINNFGGAESESEWYKDFILFTNLQIAFYNNPNLIQNNEEFELLCYYTRKHIRNLRSYVAKNAQLFIECLIFSFNDYKTLDNLSFKIIPELLVCTGSEKSTYRDSSKNNLKFLVSKSSKYFNQEILWIFFEYSKSLNKKISSFSAEMASEYFMNSTRDYLSLLDINKFTEYLEYGLRGKNVEVRSSFKKIVVTLPDLLSQEKLSLFILESLKKPFLLEIVKKEFPTIL